MLILKKQQNFFFFCSLKSFVFFIQYLWYFYFWKKDIIRANERENVFLFSQKWGLVEVMMKEREMSIKEKNAEKLYYILRITALLAAVLVFVPGMNPARISSLINKNMSLFTSAVSYSGLTNECGRAFRMGWVSESVFVLLMFSSILIFLGILLGAAGGCMSVGNRKLKNLGINFSLSGAIVEIVGIILLYVSYLQMSQAQKQEKIGAEIPNGFWYFLVLAIIMLFLSFAIRLLLPKAGKEEVYEMDSKYQLFLMFLPFATLAFLFCYLPLYGWRYAFFDYKAGGTLSADNFVGLKWFTYLFQNEATRKDILRVLKNTLAMSGLGIITSWIPMAFAIFLNEFKSKRFRRFVQTFTTIPNFVSWVLIYAIALAIFSTDGFVNTFAMSMGWITEGTNYLMGDHLTWLKMLGWGLWKGVGWSAIIYIAGISGIDRQLYEAATVDGAGRFQRMWHVTLPGLLPTYCVMLLMAIAGILSNGMDQYLVFQNATNSNHIMVLDLYVYNLGIGNGSIPLSTVVSMAKSLISVILLFVANNISKAIRGESIV